MKKIISVILVLSIIFVFTACAPNASMTEENITKTVDTAVTALRDFDADTLDKYVDSSTLSYIISYSKNHEQFAKLGRAIFKNLTVEVESIDIEQKTVTVSVTNKSLFEAASEFTSDLLSRYSTLQLLGKLRNDSWLDTNLTSLTDSIEKAKMNVEPVTVTLSIVQEKDNLVLSFDEAAENAVSGGALGAVKNLVG